MGDTDNDVLKSFVSLGLSEQKAKETFKNANVTKTLSSLIKEVQAVELPEGAGMLLYHLATKIKPQIMDRLSFIAKYIASNKLDSTLRIDKAIEYLLANINSVKIDEFEKSCGVGITVTPAQIEENVENYIAAVRTEILEKRYRYNSGLIMQKVRTDLPWADGKAVKNEVDLQILVLLGPKTEVDLVPVQKIDKKKTQKTETKEKVIKDDEPTSVLTILDVMKKINFHKPGENFKTDGYVVTPNTMKLLEEHLKKTDKKVVTRFPPEPNGILHIGHAKAININFGYAAAQDGICYLRYDDTNPEKEEEKFFTGIADMVQWLGYKPYKITHSSDNFEQLYKLAVILIRRELAYVCHQSADDMKGFNPKPSDWRNRPVEESLQLFEDMKNGKIDEGAATLRMKLTLEEGKMDPVAYRVRFIPHHRTKDQWCIYPTYDYTHCLCDSLENITHSLCTKEFQSRRSSYYWLCNALDIYCPVQWEYGRLNVNYTVVSKRKIAKLIEEKIVKDWDDPRLFTLTALRRRGFPAEAINNFCAQLGVTGAQSVVDPSMLEAFVRNHLNNTATRTMVVLNPIKITLINYPNPQPTKLSVPDFPNSPELGTHEIMFDKVIYIERNDFMENSVKGYRRLTREQNVGLRYAGFVIELVDSKIDEKGNIVNLLCKCLKTEDTIKPKAFIHWVSQPIEIEVRLYQPLFKHKNPEDPNEVPDGFLSDCNMDSLNIQKCYADQSLKNVKIFDKYQFERQAYFCVDPDTTINKLIFNQTVDLKEDPGKE